MLMKSEIDIQGTQAELEILEVNTLLIPKFDIKIILTLCRDILLRFFFLILSLMSLSSVKRVIQLLDKRKLTKNVSKSRP